ncbi:MAG: hypothetical protein DWQ10_17835 [Calditrichaeota bacterium]|nr:MAG: hypothetical protein DWQ10_17835 [Calditrichota bacterium]
MRNSKDFNPDQYAEWPQDGRSHIRSQLLFDFYNLLNHDLAGFDNRTSNSFKFIKVKKYDDVSPEEMKELDALAQLLINDPTKQELIEFYNRSKIIKLEAAKKDPYSFVYRN